MCEHMVSLRRSSRNPVKPIDMKAVKGHVRSKLPVITAETIRNLNSFQGWIETLANFVRIFCWIPTIKCFTNLDQRTLHHPQEPKRSNTTEIVKKLGQLELDEQEWLVLTPKEKLPQPKVTSFPRPKQRADGSFIFVAPDSVSVRDTIILA